MSATATATAAAAALALLLTVTTLPPLEASSAGPGALAQGGGVCTAWVCTAWIPPGGKTSVALVNNMAKPTPTTSSCPGARRGLNLQVGLYTSNSVVT